MFDVRWNISVYCTTTNGLTCRSHERRGDSKHRYGIGLHFLKSSLTDGWTLEVDVLPMITAAQLRAARALLGIDQRKLAELAGLSVPTIQRMEASDGVIRGNVESLTKLITALNAAGVELIGDRAATHGTGRGVRLFK